MTDVNDDMPISTIGRYEMNADLFHCDVKQELQIGHLGNSILNAANSHSNDRGFGFDHLSSIHKTWVLSRLCVEMYEMPKVNKKFFLETWLESAMRFFTKRNFLIEDKQSGKVLGYARSVWAMIDTETRQPVDISSAFGDQMGKWIVNDKPCPIEKAGRAKLSEGAVLAKKIDVGYCDIDVNGHVNSIKYIEHVLDLFSVGWHKTHTIRRIDIAYVAESYYGDTLAFYSEEVHCNEIAIRILKSNAMVDNVEVVRCIIRIE